MASMVIAIVARIIPISRVTTAMPATPSRSAIGLPRLKSMPTAMDMYGHKNRGDVARSCHNGDYERNGPKGGPGLCVFAIGLRMTVLFVVG